MKRIIYQCNIASHAELSVDATLGSGSKLLQMPNAVIEMSSHPQLTKETLPTHM